jgi:hypothetical protein
LFREFVIEGKRGPRPAIPLKLFGARVRLSGGQAKAAAQAATAEALR